MTIEGAEQTPLHDAVPDILISKRFRDPDFPFFIHSVDEKGLVRRMVEDLELSPDQISRISIKFGATSNNGHDSLASTRKQWRHQKVISIYTNRIYDAELANFERRYEDAREESAVSRQRRRIWRVATERVDKRDEVVETVRDQTVEILIRELARIKYRADHYRRQRMMRGALGSDEFVNLQMRIIREKGTYQDWLDLIKMESRVPPQERPEPDQRPETEVAFYDQDN